eukprot:g3632.t1
MLPSQPSMGICRNDFIVDAKSGLLRQVEFNTIAVAFGGLSGKVASLHEYVKSRFRNEEEEEDVGRSAVSFGVPKNPVKRAVAEALARAHRAYLTSRDRRSGGDASSSYSNVVVLFVVNPSETFCLVDQREIEHELWNTFGISCVRKTLSDLYDASFKSWTPVADKGRLPLIVDDDEKGEAHEVSVVYFRSGYGPECYPSENEWTARLKIEASAAIKCPSAKFQLLGTKIVQAALSDEHELKRFVDKKSEAFRNVKSCFARQWRLHDLGTDPRARDAVEDALKNPAAYVLKPQREGGGHVLFGESLRKLLRGGVEEDGILDSWVLMERIRFESRPNVLVRNGRHEVSLCDAELGIYSVEYFDKLSSTTDYAGWLLRVKAQSSVEGGVSSGGGYLSSPALSNYRKEFGIRCLPGTELVSRSDYKAIVEFLRSTCWRLTSSSPTTKLSRNDDNGANDPLLGENRYGKFMFAFDFHLTPNGPKLIEINHSADGIMAVMRVVEDPKTLERALVQSIRKEYAAAAVVGAPTSPRCAVVYSAVRDESRRMPEFEAFAEMISKNGLDCVVASSSQLRKGRGGYLEMDETGEKIDFIYNKLDSDRLLRLPAHSHIRDAIVDGRVAISPHPASYDRCCDKRRLRNMKHAAVLECHDLRARDPKRWWRERHRWVFKPPTGFASRGVTLGKTLKQGTLRKMIASDETVHWQVQEFAPPCPSADGVTKFDVRVYASGGDVLACVTRHFVGTVMGFAHPRSGMRGVRIFEDGAREGTLSARAHVSCVREYEARKSRDAKLLTIDDGANQEIYENPTDTKRSESWDETSHRGKVRQTELMLRRATGEYIAKMPSRAGSKKRVGKVVAVTARQLRLEMTKRSGFLRSHGLAAIKKEFFAMLRERLPQMAHIDTQTSASSTSRVRGDDGGKRKASSTAPDASSNAENEFKTQIELNRERLRRESLNESSQQTKTQRVDLLLRRCTGEFIANMGVRDAPKKKRRARLVASTSKNLRRRVMKSADLLRLDLVAIKEWFFQKLREEMGSE